MSRCRCRGHRRCFDVSATLACGNANPGYVARAQFLPSFELTADGGLVSYGLAHFTTPPLIAYTLLASITQPIFSGGKLTGQLDYSQARYEELFSEAARRSRTAPATGM